MVLRCGSRTGYGNEMRGELSPRSESCTGLAATCVSSQSEMVRYEQLVQTGNIAKQLADDIVQYVTVSPVPPVTCRYAETMRRVVDEASLRHKIVFENIIHKVGVRNKSQPVDATMCQQTFEAVANELFNDGHYNWGRIAMLYAFAAWLAKHPSDQPSAGGNDEVALAVAEAAGDYVARRLSTWICQQGGWDTMEIFFQDHHSFESAMWRGLMAVLVGLGAMAFLASLTR